MDEVANYCQDWHPDGSPRTIVTVRNGVRSVTTLPAKPPQSQASIRANYRSKAQAELDPK